MKTIAIAAKKIDWIMITNLFMFTLLTAALLMLMSADVFASIASAINNVKIQAQTIVGPLGTIAIICLGIAAMFGRISWTQALIVAVGIVVAVYASQIYADIAR